MTDFVEQIIGVRQGCSLNTYLFNIFIDDIIDCIREGNVHASITGNMSVTRMLFAEV
jgi:hypothetical protein